MYITIILRQLAVCSYLHQNIYCILRLPTAFSTLSLELHYPFSPIKPRKKHFLFSTNAITQALPYLLSNLFFIQIAANCAVVHVVVALLVGMMVGRRKNKPDSSRFGILPGLRSELF